MASRTMARITPLAFALLASTPGAPAQAGDAAPPVLTYLTLNLFHGGVSSGLTGRDDYLEERLDLVAGALHALAPDVVGVQEASTGRQRGHVAARLAERLGFQHVYGPALFRLFGWGWLDDRIADLMNFSEGPAILSRFPIARSEVLALPRCRGFVDPRVLVFALVVTPWGRLPVFSTHVSGAPCQTRAVAELVRERRTALPAVVMGDFNAMDDSPAITTLIQDAGFVDVFRAANRTAAGATVYQRVTAPVPMARRRVDYLFLLPGIEFPGHVVSSRVVLDQPGRRADGQPLWPSDHYGVLARLAVFPPATATADAARASRDGDEPAPSGGGR